MSWKEKIVWYVLCWFPLRLCVGGLVGGVVMSRMLGPAAYIVGLKFVLAGAMLMLIAFVVEIVYLFSLFRSEQEPC